MKRNHFIAMVLGLSIATSGFAAAPARASDNTGKIIAGVAALAIIGTAIANSSDDHDDHAKVTRHKNSYENYNGYGYKPYKKSYKKKHHKKKYGHKRYKKHYGHKSYKKGYGHKYYKKKSYSGHHKKRFKRAYAY
ncbi:hypothetical protein [Roseovarius sp. EL26]|uniref:hypothetical protein n=1 Tax=Roseovarius sp. EL26 TaxID=2126672 RepID=UPI000EA24C94|nr:hypothetical protein [Roseovarius sp. EL26]